MGDAEVEAGQRFERYLEAHGHHYAPVKKGPRGLLAIELAGARAACAVEAVAAPAADAGERERTEPVRRALARAAIRLAPAAAVAEAAGLAPAIAVLASPGSDGGGPAILNDWYVRAAIAGAKSLDGPSGLVVVHERAHADDLLDQAQALRSLGGEGSGSAPGCAVCALAAAPAEGTYLWVEVFELHDLNGAAPIPRRLFAGQRDQWFGRIPGSTAYGYVAAGAPATP